MVEGCGDAEAELLLQQGITSLEDLAHCDVELLTQLPGIDEAGARRSSKRAGELAQQKRKQEEEAARREPKRRRPRAASPDATGR